MLTPGIILATGFIAVLLLATVLQHRREKAALYLPSPRTPERDAGFDEGLDQAVRAITEVSAASAGAGVPVKTLIAGVRAARRGAR